VIARGVGAQTSAFFYTKFAHTVSVPRLITDFPLSDRALAYTYRNVVRIGKRQGAALDGICWHNLGANAALRGVRCPPRCRTS
jgi:hypothetical protein